MWKYNINKSVKFIILNLFATKLMMQTNSGFLTLLMTIITGKKIVTFLKGFF